MKKSKKKTDFNDYFEKTDFGDVLQKKDVQKIQFELQPKDQLISLRISKDLLKLLKLAASKQGTKYQKLVRLILEKNIGKYV